MAENKEEVYVPPFGAEEILGSNPSVQIHKKPLHNAENFLKKGNIKSALEIYSRVQQRIKDPEANRKIQEIIQGIGELAPRAESNTIPKQIPSSRIDQKLNFTKVLQDLTNVVTHLSSTIQKQPSEPSAPPPVEQPVFTPPPIPQGNPTVEPSQGILNRLEILEDMIANQEWKDERQEPIEDRRSGSERRMENIPVDKERRTGDERREEKPESKDSSEILERLDALEKQNQELAEKIPKIDAAQPGPASTVPSPSPPMAAPESPATPQSGSPVAPPGAPFQSPPSPDLSKIVNRLDTLEELYNREDWKDLQDLPLRDRRTGEDRRKESIPVDEERRTGDERREEDLIEKRDEFVSDWQENLEKGEPPPPPSSDQNKLRKEAPPVPPPIPPIRTTLERETTDLPKINLPDPVILHPSNFQEAPKRSMSLESGEIPQPAQEGLKPSDVLFPTEKEAQIHEIFKINLPNPKDTSFKNRESEEEDDEPQLDRDINIIDSPLSDEEYEKAVENRPEISIPEIDTESKEPPEPERVMHGILELKPPEVDDAPFLTLTYDFAKIPHSFRLSKNYSIMEYSYYKYKPMLMKAQEFARRKMLKNALNYYRVIRSQNIPPELKHMINRNITDITEFLEKFIMSKGG